jgi:capsular polysaccharide biosynthesis protein
MTQKALDLRRSAQIARHHKILVGMVVALGAVVGGGYAVLNPPMLTSTALIALQPPASQSTQNTQQSTTSGIDPFTATQEVVAASDPVLLAALHDARPAVSLNQLRHDIQVGSPATDIISVNAKGENAADAEATANAVVSSYIAYVSTANSPVGHVSARQLQLAITASGPSRAERTAVFALLGALVGALIAFVVVLVIGRNDRKLRERDEIARSIGVSVLASFPVAHPADAAGWTKLLEEYKPAEVYALRLRQALEQLGTAPVNGNGTGNGTGQDGSSVTILSLSSDSGALALGPQLAVFAASRGTPTTLVIGPQQDANAMATLRTAFAAPPPASSTRPSLLRVVVTDSVVDMQPDTALTVVTAVVDRDSPQLPETMRTSATVLGVSASAATAEQLARAANAAAAVGRHVVGILVADPEPTDRTTGLILQLPRPANRRLATRLRGMTTEIKR